MSISICQKATSEDKGLITHTKCMSDLEAKFYKDLSSWLSDFNCLKINVPRSSTCIRVIVSYL